MPDRVSFTSIGSHILLAVAFGSFASASGAATRPNLVIIQTDEHNFRTLGCYRRQLAREQALMWGPSVVETPHIDSIATAGAICTSFYATTPVCSPSRASFMSGQYPHQTPVVTNNIPLRDDIITFAEDLRRAGYATGYAGKWHLDGGGKPQWKPERQFGFEDNRYMYNRGHWKKMEDTQSGPRVAARKNNKPTYAVDNATDKSFTTDYLADKAVDFIRTHQAESFCFMVSLPDPHGPDTVRAPYDTMYAEQTYQKPRTYDGPSEGLPGWAARTRCGYNQSKYYGMVKCIDDNVGKILKVIDDLALADRTIVVFTADHGDLRGEHARHNKGVPFEASAGVPFVIRYPAKIPRGLVVTEAMATVDFRPSVLHLMDIRPAGEVAGRDCSRLWTSEGPVESWDDIVFLRGTGGGPTGTWLAAVTDRYKLVWGPNDSPWLYDLQEDPDEKTNFFFDPACRETVTWMSQQMLAYGKRWADPRIDLPGIQFDLQWAVGRGTTYRAADRPKPDSNRNAAKGKRRREK